LGRSWQRAEIILRSSGTRQPPLKLTTLLSTTLLFGITYGAVMGSYAGLAPDRWQQILYSAVKVPLLVLVSFALSLPTFYVLHALLGLADDFRTAVRGLAATQSCLAIVLASLAPFTAFWYVCVAEYRSAITFNGLMFAVASLSAQVLLRRHYRALLAKNPRHRWMLLAWLLVYAFVAIQLAWILRPFIGDPKQPPQFFRHDPLSDNAYVVVLKLAWRFLTGML
jgi:hypothetical protein